MKQRVITAAFILAAALPVLFFSQYIEYPIVLSLLSLIGCFEMLRVLVLHRELLVAIPTYLLALTAPLIFYCLYLLPRQDKLLTLEEVRDCLTKLALAYFVYLLYLMAAAVLRRGRLLLSTVATVFFMTVYIVTSFTAMCLIRYMPHGVYAFALIFIAAWISDVFAYLVGTLIGRHKLIPEISPKKTVEGAVGGILFATAAFLLYGFAVGRVFDLRPNYVMLLLSGALLAIVSQVGDLVASLLKREHGVKDYGRLFPGHGGVMDRFDSVLAVSTVLIVICLRFPPFLP